jgi:predicted nucleotidyltransferase
MPSMKLKEEALRDPVLAEIVSNLVEAYEPLTIYLFGSKARGEAGPDSDYDLMVIVPDDAPPERRRSRLAYERLWDTGSAADVLVWTQEAFISRSHLKASLPGVILREGRLLYAA